MFLQTSLYSCVPSTNASMIKLFPSTTHNFWYGAYFIWYTYFSNNFLHGLVILFQEESCHIRIKHSFYKLKHSYWHDYSRQYLYLAQRNNKFSCIWIMWPEFSELSMKKKSDILLHFLYFLLMTHEVKFHLRI